MERKVLGPYVDVLSAVLAVLFLDVLLYGYFRTVGIYSNQTFIPVDIMFIGAAALLGKRSAKKIEFPVWQARHATDANSKGLLISILIGSFIVIINTMVLSNSDISSISWLKFSNFFQPLLMSLRASLTEELLYRLLIFSVAAQFAGSFFKSRPVGIAAGALVSSFLFGLLHQGFYFSFVIGVGLCCIYMNNGLIFAMVVHFLANLIPYMLIYLR